MVYTPITQLITIRVTLNNPVKWRSYHSEKSTSEISVHVLWNFVNACNFANESKRNEGTCVSKRIIFSSFWIRLSSIENAFN